MKLPRDISGGRAVRAFERLGFRVVRQTGSHIRLSDGRRKVTIPAHGTLAAGTLQNVLRQAGLDLETFLKAYH